MAERNSEETFCAPATAPINSSLAVVRVNGPGALDAVRSMFSRPEAIVPRKASYGSIMDNGRVVDDVVLVYFKAPHSFTGDDIVEITCHGNQFIVHRIIRMLNDDDVRIAEPGEFSKRAFMNGKMGLTEAEAINHIITARSEWEVETALKQMHGSLSNEIMTIREAAIVLKADIEAGIDFIEEDISFVSHGESLKRIQEIRELTGKLIRRCVIGQKVSRGIDVAIAGKPNVGKSSILNLILNQERAIVSEIPGTTRDMIRESVQISGVHINLIDMAGIDTPGGQLEKIGIELSNKKIEESPLLLCVLDATTGISEADRFILEKVKNKTVIYLINKTDISLNRIDEIQQSLPDQGLPFSAKTGQGLNDLEKRITQVLNREFIDFHHSFIADMRVITLLEKTLAHSETVQKLLHQQEPAEIVAFEIQCMLDSLAEVTGEISPDDVLNSIFSRFCIGK